MSTHDDAFSDDRLNQASVETIGKMDHQGLAPMSHNSGDISFYGPIGDPSDHNGPPAGGGYDSVS